MSEQGSRRCVRAIIEENLGHSQTAAGQELPAALFSPHMHDCIELALEGYCNTYVSCYKRVFSVERLGGGTKLVFLDFTQFIFEENLLPEQHFYLSWLHKQFGSQWAVSLDIAFDLHFLPLDFERTRK